MTNAVIRKRAIPAGANECSPAKKMCMSKGTHTPAKGPVGFKSLHYDLTIDIFHLLDYETKVRAEEVCCRWRNVLLTHSWRQMTSLNSSFFPSLSKNFPVSF
uniref:F-box domain-containing protein n=1 Tax=Ditylenchus dipsaci TaxID=166011 RepID=A0A915DM69_9BILA